MSVTDHVHVNGNWPELLTSKKGNEFTVEQNINSKHEEPPGGAQMYVAQEEPQRAGSGVTRTIMRAGVWVAMGVAVEVAVGAKVGVAVSVGVGAAAPVVELWPHAASMQSASTPTNTTRQWPAERRERASALAWWPISRPLTGGDGAARARIANLSGG
jgi:hypothetical protein